jgi:hypothetical protein
LFFSRDPDGIARLYHDQDELSLRTKRGGTCTPGKHDIIQNRNRNTTLTDETVETTSDIGQAFISDAAKADICVNVLATYYVLIQHL